MRVLNCEVSEALWERWEAHFVPSTQPFFVSDALAERLETPVRWTRPEFRAMGVALSLADTLGLHDVSRDAPWVLPLDEEIFAALSQEERHDLLAEQRRRGGAARLSDWLEHAPPADKAALQNVATEGLFVW